MGDNLIEIANHNDLPATISEIMLKVAGNQYNSVQPAVQAATQTPTESDPTEAVKISL